MKFVAIGKTFVVKEPVIPSGANKVLFLLALVYLPPLQRVFGTAPVPAVGWLFVLAWMPALYAAEALRRLGKGWWSRCRSW